jgi:competence protein ComEC
VALGLTAARSFHLPSTTWFAAGLGFCALCIWARPRPCRTALAAALFCAAAGWMQSRIFEQPASRLSPEDNALITIEGTLLSTPREVQGRGAFAFLNQPRTRLDLRADTLLTSRGPLPTSGKLWVSIRSRPPAQPLRAGDRLRVTGRFGHLDGPLNHGEEDLRLYAAQVGVAGSLTLSSPDLIQVLPPPTALTGQLRSWWLRTRAALEDRSRAIIARASGSDEGEPGRALLLGLILGDYDPHQRDVRDAFTRQGLAHVLSISGFHLSVMALLALSLLRLTGDRGWVEPLSVAALVLLYLLIVPASSPILRSAAMVLAIMLAEASGRRYDRLTLLGWIAIALLIWRPLDLWNPGYQLSLGLTATLFWLGPLCHARLWGLRIEGLVRREITVAEWIIDHLKQSVSAAVLCWAVSLPLVMYRFGLVSPLAIASTVFITPFIVLLLWVGYIALLIGVLIPPAADAAGYVLSQLSAWTVACVRLFDAVPGSALRIPVVSALWAAAATAVIVYWVRTGHWKDWRAWSASALAAAWLAYQCLFSSGLDRAVALRMDTIAVGDGTCHLLRSGNDALLWDCGPMRDGGVTPPLLTTIRALGAWRVPTLIISHPDLDHFGGVAEAVRPLGIKRVLVGHRFIEQAADQPTGAAAMLLLELRLLGVDVAELHAGDTLTLGDSTLTFLAPPPNAPWPQDNDHSLVARVGIGQEPNAILLTGDIQDEAIRSLSAGNPGLSARVLELPHHGSARPPAIAFAYALRPEVVIQSTGPRRANDPRWDAVRQHTTWYTTSEHGAAFVEFQSSGLMRSGSFR